VHFDMPLEQLREYRPEVAEPGDFDAFWAAQSAAAAEHPLDVEVVPVDSVITAARVYDVRFAGHGGARIAAWLLVPKHLDEQTPVVVEFIGYNGGRGRALDWLQWSAAGFPHLVVDNRGQGGGWRGGDTADPADGGEPGGKTMLTRGLSHPSAHYYSRLYIDAARAIAAARAVPELASRPVLSAGGSQGGALALAAASLSQQAAAVLPDVPFLAHFRRAASLTDEAPYSEIAEYCKVYPDRVEQVFHTLSYFDVVNHAKRISVPGLFSVGLADLVTPPSTVFAAYNAYAGEKQIEVYEFNGHEGGGSLHTERKVQFARSLASEPAPS
jgi:cephalosporin-C deacetylase